MTNKILIWLTAGFAILILTVIILVDVGRLPAFLGAVYAYPAGDKLGHFFLFGILALLADQVIYPPTSGKFRRKVLDWVNWALSGMIIFEELTQLAVPGRSFSLLDMAASLLGVACAYGFTLWQHHRRVSEKKSSTR